jgi:hypothetical protein
MPVASLKIACGRIQRDADYPLYQSLPDSRVAENLIGEVDFVNNDLNLTGRPWHYRMFPLTVTSGEDFHAITEVGDFTVPFAVETTNPANPNHIVRVVVIDDPTDAVRFGNAGTLGPPNVMHSAVSVSFTEHPEQVGLRAARFAPKPNAQATYNVYYVPNVIRPQSLTDPITDLPQFEEYIHVRTLLRCLPYCEWEGFDGEANAAKRRTLTGDVQTPGSHAARFMELQNQFIRMRRQSHQNHSGPKIVAFGRLGRIRGR